MAEYLNQGILYVQNNPIIDEVEDYLDKQIPIFAQNRGNYMGGQIDPEKMSLDLSIPVQKSLFVFHSCYLFYYKINNQFYIDIDHIVTALVKSANLNYDDHYRRILKNFCQKICFSQCVSKGVNDNKTRSFVDLITMAAMIVSVKCPFSDMFQLQCLLCMILIKFLYWILIIVYLRQIHGSPFGEIELSDLD